MSPDDPDQPALVDGAPGASAAPEVAAEVTGSTRSSGSKRRRAAGSSTAAETPAPAPPEEPQHSAEVRIELPNFEGPLDLLLHLIQEHELDILDIPISFVTAKYLRYLELMRTLSIDLASEYLVMAATLALIKSRMLLPKDPSATATDDDDDELDPREELVRRLLEYQKYKAAAGDLGVRATLGSDVFPRGDGEPAPPGPTPFAETPVFALLDAFEKLLSKTKIKLEHQVVFDRISISDRITELLDRLRGRRTATLEDLLLGPAEGGEARALTRFDLVITFLAVLEMCKLRLLRIFQASPLESLYLELAVSDEGEEDDDSRGERPASSADEPSAEARDPNPAGETDGADGPESD